jgi:hypothetical protein
MVSKEYLREKLTYTMAQRILDKMPSWIVTVCVALVVSYTTIQLKVNTLETRNSVIQERINQLDETKANKELFQESTSRLDRIESKLDRLIESKQK